MTTPTPRTDAECMFGWQSGGGVRYSRDPEGSVVLADHARRLERELAEAHRENHEQARLLDMSATREAKHLAMLDQLQRDLTRRDTLIERILDYPYLPQNLATIIRKEMENV